MDTAATRIARIILGIWLFLSAFLWQHGPEQFANTWIVGLAIVLFALIGGARIVSFRMFSVLAAIWLFISLWVLPTPEPTTRWNNAVVAVLVVLFTLVPGGRRRPILPADRRVRV